MTSMWTLVWAITATVAWIAWMLVALRWMRIARGWERTARNWEKAADTFERIAARAAAFPNDVGPTV